MPSITSFRGSRCAEIVLTLWRQRGRHENWRRAQSRTLVTSLAGIGQRRVRCSCSRSRFVVEHSSQAALHAVSLALDAVPGCSLYVAHCAGRAAMDDRAWRLYLAMLCVITFAWHHFQAPWWDNAPGLAGDAGQHGTGAGYEGTDEYTPVGADPSAVDKDARRVTVDGPARRRFEVSQWNAESETIHGGDVGGRTSGVAFI